MIKRSFGIVLCLMFVCASNAFAEEQVVEGSNYTLTVKNVGEFTAVLTGDENIDEDWDCSYLTVHTVSAFAKGEKGYYVRLGDFVYFCSFDENAIVPLCNRPDCFHDKETDSKRRQECTAYVGYGEINNGLQYYNGRLYANVSSDYIDTGDDPDAYVREYLYELRPDGSGRELMKWQMDNAYSFAIHRGIIYFTSRGTDPDTLESSEAVYRLDMDSAKTEEIASLKSTDAVFRVYPFGDYVYIQIKLAAEDESDMIIYDIEDRQAKLVKRNWNSMFFKTADGQLLECVSKDDGLLAAYVDGELETVAEIGTLKADKPSDYGFNDDDTVNLSNWVSADEEQLYVYGMAEAECVTAVFSRTDGELKQVISMDGLPLYQYIGTDDNRIFYQCTEADGWMNEVYWLDKEELLDEGTAFQKLEP